MAVSPLSYFIKTKNQKLKRIGLLALTSLPYARIIEFRFKGYVPMLSGLSAFQLP